MARVHPRSSTDSASNATLASSGVRRSIRWSCWSAPFESVKITALVGDVMFLIDSSAPQIATSSAVVDDVTKLSRPAISKSNSGIVIATVAVFLALLIDASVYT